MIQGRDIHVIGIKCVYVLSIAHLFITVNLLPISGFEDILNM